MDNDFDIDQYRLDYEWLRQPKLYQAYAKAEAQAEHAVGIAEAKLRVVEADLHKQISEDPSTYGLAKSTVDAINAAVKIQPEFRAATQNLLQLRHEHKLHVAALRTLEHRKRALENLVRLFELEYFGTMPRTGGPRSPRGAGVRPENAAGAEPTAGGPDGGWGT